MPHPSNRNPPAIPPENGQRPSFDANGEVHGSGIGIGGGSPGEEFDDNSAGGTAQSPGGGAPAETTPGEASD